MTIAKINGGRGVGSIYVSMQVAIILVGLATNGFGLGRLANQPFVTLQ